MSASADIQTQTNVNVLSVPLNAVTTRDFNDLAKTDSTLKKNSTDNSNNLAEVVFVIDKDNKVKPVVVTTDIQDINYIQILSGLKAGDNVVTGPYDTVSKLLKSGDKVKVVDKLQLTDAAKKSGN